MIAQSDLPFADISLYTVTGEFSNFNTLNFNTPAIALSFKILA